jgi:hypothetical protein
MNTNPKGYTCTTCGKFTEWPLYVYAHSMETLNSSCNVCGEKFKVCRMIGVRTKKGKIPIATTTPKGGAA